MIKIYLSLCVLCVSIYAMLSVFPSVVVFHGNTDPCYSVKENIDANVVLLYLALRCNTFELISYVQISKY